MKRGQARKPEVLAHLASEDGRVELGAESDDARIGHELEAGDEAFHRIGAGQLLLAANLVDQDVVDRARARLPQQRLEGVVVPDGPLGNGHGTDGDDAVLEHAGPGGLEVEHDEARERKRLRQSRTLEEAVPDLGQSFAHCRRRGRAGPCGPAMPLRGTAARRPSRAQ